MMLGGITSMWLVNYLRDEPYFKTPIKPRLLFSRPVQIALYSFYVLYLVAAVYNASLYNDQFLSILTAGVLANLALNPDCVISLENKFLSFIGKISFGLYLLHKFPVELMIRSTQKWGITNVLAQNLIIYSGAVVLAIGLAYLSFTYYEAYFLKMKEKKFGLRLPSIPWRLKKATS